jgi:septum formation protein
LFEPAGLGLMLLEKQRMTKSNKIYLASQSPRRRELLKQIGVQFEPLLLRNALGRTIDVDETPLENEDPVIYVQRICLAKAEAAQRLVTMRSLLAYPILTADTTVVLGQQIIGKPRDPAHAAEILRQLAGKSHQVLTAVALILGDRCESRLSTTTVYFSPLTEAQIKHYLVSNEAHDKAGAYGIQGQAGAFIERIDGSYTGVMGLPLFETVELLRRFSCTDL